MTFQPCRRNRRFIDLSSRGGFRLCLTIFLLLFLLASGPSSAQSPLIDWQLQVLRGADPGPSVTVFADGRVAIHKPAVFKNGGDFELTLEPDEIAELTLLAHQLESFDGDAARRSQRDLLKELIDQGQTVPTRVGTAVSSFRLQTGEQAVHLRWRGGELTSSVSEGSASENQDIQRLARLEQRLRDLLEDPRQTRVASL